MMLASLQWKTSVPNYQQIEFLLKKKKTALRVILQKLWGGK